MSFGPWGVDPESARLLQRLPSQLHRPAAWLIALVSTLINRRVFGLASEGGFWFAFALPWVLLTAAAVAGAIGSVLGQDVKEELENRVLSLAETVFTDQAMVDYIEPIVAGLFQTNLTGLGLVSFAVALWSASRAVSTWVEATQILNDNPRRSWLANRAIGLLLFLASTVALGLAIAIGSSLPDIRSSVTGGSTPLLAIAYVIVVLTLLGVAAALPMTAANSSATRWYHAIPGGVVATAAWAIGTLGLQFYLLSVYQSASVLGALGVPIALMLWLLITNYAVLLGISVNAVNRRLRASSDAEPADLPTTPSGV